MEPATEAKLAEIETRQEEVAGEMATAGSDQDKLRTLGRIYAELTEIVRGILRGGSCPTAESFYRLRSAGLVTGDSEHSPSIRCHLYARYLEQHL